MSDNVMVTKLIDEAKKIVSDVETLRNRNGSDFNIFSVLGVENKDVRICMFLHELLLPKGSHGAGSVYLKAFVEKVLGLNGFIKSDYDNAIVTKEEHF